MKALVEDQFAYPGISCNSEVSLFKGKYPIVLLLVFHLFTLPLTMYFTA